MCRMTALAYCGDGAFMDAVRYWELNMKKNALIEMINDFVVTLNC